MTDHIDWDRLARYVSGEAGARERADLERWAASDPAHQVMLDSVRRRWELSAEGSRWDVDAAWNRVAPQLLAGRAAVSARTLTPRIGRSPWLRASRLVPLAAAATLLVALSLNSRGRRDTPAAGSVSVAAGAALRTGVGELRSYRLPDGSEVSLGAASSLRIGSDFGASSRELYLEGQAFIRVRHDASRPFVVNAAGTRTVDVGTAFEVRAYANEGVRVAVTEGSVEVHQAGRATGEAAVLQAGDVARLDAAGEATIARRQDVDQLLGWLRGELAFDDTPLSAVAEELERWYDVDCRIEDPGIGNLHLTARLRIGESLDEILNLVDLSLASRGVRAVREGRVVTFRGGATLRPSALPLPATPRRVEAGA